MWKTLIVFILLLGTVSAYTAPSNSEVTLIFDLNYTAPSASQIEIRLWDANATPPEAGPTLLSCTFNNLGNLTKYEYYTNMTINCTDNVSVSVDSGLDNFLITNNIGYYLIDLLRLRLFNDGLANKTVSTTTGWNQRLSPDSYSCNDQWHSSFPCSNIYDNNTATYGKSIVAAWANASSDANYTVYNNVTYYMQVTNGYNGTLSNITLADNCNLTDKLQFRVESFINFTDFTNGARWFCVNNSQWNRVYFVSNGYPSAHNRVYDLILWQYVIDPLVFAVNNASSVVYNVTINITGNNQPYNTKLFYGANTISFHGILNGNQLTQNLINGKPEINISYSERGRQIVYMNISTASLDIQHRQNFTISFSGFSIDSQNFFDFTETFNDTNSSTNKINSTITGITAPLTVYDDMEYNVTTHEVWNESGICSETGCTQYITQDESDNYYFMETIYPNVNAISTLSSSVNVINRTLFFADVDMYSTARCGGWGDYTSCSSTNAKMALTDGTNSVVIKELPNVATRGYGIVSSSSFDGNITVKKSTNDNYAVYENDVYTKTISTTTLAQYDWRLIFVSQNSCQNYPCAWPSETPAQSTIKINSVKMSGLKLNRTVGNYTGNGSMTTKLLFTAPTNISTAVLSGVQEIKPSGTNIVYEVSNNGLAWKIILPYERIGFSSVGNLLYFRVNFSSTDMHYSPELVQYRLSILPSVANNLSVDIGYDGSKEYNLTGILNESNSPVNAIPSIQSILSYAQTYCLNLSTCNIPIAVTVASAGQVMLHNINFTTYLNPVFLSPVYFDSTTYPEINLLINNGAIKISDVRMDYRGDANLSFDMTLNTTTINYVIRVIYSNFNASLPINISWYDVFPKSRFDVNVTPYGQKNDTPIWLIRNQGQNNMDMYIRLNVSLPSTINATFTLNKTKTGGVRVNSTAQKLCSNIATGGNCSVWNYWDFMNHTGRFYLPVFYFSGICSDCVLTDKYWQTNLVVD